MNTRRRLTLSNNRIPIGSIIVWIGPVIPDKYLICDGSPISKLEYPKLASILGDTYGASTDTTVILPDFRGRLPVGVDPNDEDFISVGYKDDTKGVKAASLSVSQIPSHTHAQSSCSSAGAHTHAVTARSGSSGSTKYADAYTGYKSQRTITRTSSAGAHSSHTLNLDSKGSGTAPTHNNLQPYQIGYFIIKAL